MVPCLPPLPEDAAIKAKKKRKRKRETVAEALAVTRDAPR
jgi:hypothetical protein